MVIFATGVSFTTGCNSKRKRDGDKTGTGRWKKEEAETNGAYCTTSMGIYVWYTYEKCAEWRVRNGGRGMMAEEWRSEVCGTTLVHTMTLYTGLSISSAADYSFLQPPTPFFNVHHCCLLSLLTTNTFASSTPTDWLLLYFGCCIHNERHYTIL